MIPLCGLSLDSLEYVPPGDLDLGFPETEVVEESATELPLPQLPQRIGRLRTRYGYGIDAQRTARYRGYPLNQSVIVRTLQHMYGTVTKPLLSGVIALTLSEFPDWGRSMAPTRAQKRSKGGLLAWLDDHAALVVPLLETRLIAP
jgi:hypothetical protein